MYTTWSDDQWMRSDESTVQHEREEKELCCAMDTKVQQKQEALFHLWMCEEVKERWRENDGR